MDQNITLKIAGKEYPLKATTPEMEKYMRLAAEAINKKLALYDAKFPGKDLTDKLVFAALNESVGRISAQYRYAALEEQQKQLLGLTSGYLESIEKK